MRRVFRPILGAAPISVVWKEEVYSEGWLEAKCVCVCMRVC